MHPRQHFVLLFSSVTLGMSWARTGICVCSKKVTDRIWINLAEKSGICEGRVNQLKEVFYSFCAGRRKGPRLSEWVVSFVEVVTCGSQGMTRHGQFQLDPTPPGWVRRDWLEECFEERKANKEYQVLTVKDNRGGDSQQRNQLLCMHWRNEGETSLLGVLYAGRDKRLLWCHLVNSGTAAPGILTVTGVCWDSTW